MDFDLLTRVVPIPDSPQAISLIGGAGSDVGTNIRLCGSVAEMAADRSTRLMRKEWQRSVARQAGASCMSKPLAGPDPRLSV